MIGDKLFVVGGVWLHPDGVPGVVIVNLTTHSSEEFSLDTVSFRPLSVLMHPPQVVRAGVCCFISNVSDRSALIT